MWRRVLWALPVPIALVGVWYLAVQLQWVRLVPWPQDVAKEMVDFTFGGVHRFPNPWSATMPTHLAASAQRVLVGFAAAVLTAVPLGILMGRYRRLAFMTEPTINVVRPFPVTAWAPLMMVIVGIGSTTTSLLVFIAAFYPLLVNTVAGVKAVPPRLVEAAQMLGTRPRDVLWRIVLPAALPSIFTGMRVALALGWVVLVIGESVGIKQGLGSVIWEARDTSRTDVLIAGMIFIGLAGLVTDLLLSGAMRLALRGRPLLAST